MMVLVAALLALPFVAWLMVSRYRKTRWIVGLVLLGWIGLAVDIVQLFPRARLEIILGYIPVAAAIIWFGRRREHRSLGLPEPQPSAWTVRILIAVAIPLIFICGPFLFYITNSEPSMPSADELLPLPQGIQATDITGHPSCGSGACGRRFIMSGRPGQSAEELRDLVSRHLEGRGWELDADGQDCRGAGWLLDQTDICVSVFTHDGAVYVALEGWRAWP